MPDDDPRPIKKSLAIDLMLAHPAWLKAWPGARAQARRAVKATLNACRKRLPRKPALAVSVVLADDAFVRALNAAHRGKDKPTNVLSFPMARHVARSAPEAPLGDIVLAYETVAAEAADARLSLADHSAHLLIHGALHLLGFGHEKEEAARLMDAAEAKILRELRLSRKSPARHS